ncbi:hypothetical protein EJB05_39264, partial [Eragrostis curvula]
CNFTFVVLMPMDDKSKIKKEIDGSLVPPPRKVGISLAVQDISFSKASAYLAFPFAMYKGKLKFAPKVPPKKAAKVVPKTEPIEDSKDDIVDKELLMKLKTSQITDPFARKVKTEDKCESAAKLPKEYADPWDYDNTDYPVTLPLRRPYSGDPEILDEEEFGESSGSRAQDTELTAAEQLGLMDQSDTPQLLFFQMPSSLPITLQPQSSAERDKGLEDNAEPANTSTKERRQPHSVHGMKLKDLPGGFMGKMLVYKSGKVKMKIGDTIYDVSAGSNCMFVQEVAAMNIREKHCCTLGEVSKRAVVTPDIDYLLGSVDKMNE